MKKIKAGIIGAGSIGNHLANSCRQLDWDVIVFDKDKNSLDRFRNTIYPSRYGKFDPQIKLVDVNFLQDYQNEFDVLLIGTPPSSHLNLLKDAINLNPKLIMVEKPFVPPNLTILKEARQIIDDSSIPIYCGYNHRLSYVARVFLEHLEVLPSNSKRKVVVNWLESWDGILKAHPWLNGPEDSYLGYSNQGGGALFEHSHGIDLGVLTKMLNRKCKEGILSSIVRFHDGKVFPESYDEKVSINFQFEDGDEVNVTQDVVTLPAVKTVNFYNEKFDAAMKFGIENMDSIEIVNKENSNRSLSLKFNKYRPSDFDLEIREINRILKGEGQKFFATAREALLISFLSYVAFMSSVAKKKMKFNCENLTYEEIS